MTTYLLGSGAVVASGAGAKAANLDRAMAAGMHVPAGFVVPDAVEIAGLSARLTGLGPVVAVRSAFSAEDGNNSAMAGRFDTELGIPANETDVAAAVERVRVSGEAVPSARRDVLVMEMVAAERAGVLFTEQQFEDDLVNVVSGLAESLVSGTEAGDELRLAKLRWKERPASDLPPWQRRLAELMRDVRKEFGEGEWDIEWADDGQVCWLVQIRPITAAPRRNETFTIANHKEILPELPSVFMASVVESSSHDLMSFYRDIDPDLPVDRPFIESFAGRPYINLSQLTDLLRRIGLPTSLLADSLGGEPELLVGINPLRLVRSGPTLIKLGLAQLGSAKAARIAEADIAEAATGPFADFASTIDALRYCYVELVTQMSSLATAMTGPVAVLRSLGTLEGHLSSQRTPGTRMLDELAPMAELARRDAGVRAELEAGRLPTDPAFHKLWDRWLADHGHRGVFESDVARPRFSELPAPIIASILTYTDRTTPGAGRRSVRLIATAPIWFFARRPMAAREQIRWSAMRSFGVLRSRLLELANDAVADGRLSEADAVWDLTIEELISLDRGGVMSAGELAERRQLIAERAEMRLPDLVRRFDDLAVLTGLRDANNESSFTGVSLTSGTVTGVALRAGEPPTGLPEGFNKETTILVARSVDAGWVPSFSQVAGVAVEIGGDLSHGSIILRELGIPAITNIGAIGSSINTGDAVVLDAGAGRLELTEEDADA